MALHEIPLTGGAYQANALIAAAQEAINLYPEINPKDGQAPSPVTTYLTPGFAVLNGTPPAVQAVRASHRTSTGKGFVVIGGGLYVLDVTWGETFVGAIPTGTAPVSMSDNGLVLILVDGTTTGYVVDLTVPALTFAAFSLADGYLGADKVVFLDTFFLFNIPETNIFYSSLSEVDYGMVTGGTAFDPLDIAGKTSRSDPIVTMGVVNGEIWLVGQFTSEVWALSGGAGFPFTRIQGAVIPHGASATFGIAQSDTSLFWLMQDDQGVGMIIQTTGYGVARISTHALEREIQHYSFIADCIMLTRQEDGHYFLVVIFPTADVTWEMDIVSRQWHKWMSRDDNGILHRHRANCYIELYGKSVIGDWQNGKLYDLDHRYYDDAGLSIIRLRSFPVLVYGGHEAQYHSLILDMQPGFYDIDGTDPMVSLRWSDDGGASWGDAILISMGATGEFLRSMKIGPPLGMARNRVYEVSWDVRAKTAINRAFSEHDVMPW